MGKTFLALAAVIFLLWPPAAYADARLRATTCPVEGVAASFKVLGARTEYEGVAAEYHWLYANLPEWERTDQALIHVGRRDYDLLYIKHGRQRATICFDITDFYGKPAR